MSSSAKNRLDDFSIARPGKISTPHTTIYIPPFKAPSGHNGNILVCEASSDGKYFTADFMGQKVTVPIYQHNEDEQFLKWDAILPEKTRQPTMKIVLDQKKLLPIIKAFESSNTDPIYLTFYGILGPVIITQITDFKQTAAIICPVRPAKEKHSAVKPLNKLATGSTGSVRRRNAAISCSRRPAQSRCPCGRRWPGTMISTSASCGPHFGR